VAVAMAVAEAAADSNVQNLCPIPIDKTKSYPRQTDTDQMDVGLYSCITCLQAVFKTVL